MTDTTEAASAAAAPSSAPETLQQKIDADITTYVTSAPDHAEAAVRDWYGQHFIATQRSGRTPITSDELNRLVAQVRAAASIATKE